MNDRETIAHRVRRIVAEVLDEPLRAFTDNPTLAAHRWDSIASLEALAQLESEFGVTLDLRSFHAARTVDDMVDLVAGSRPAPTR
ncbi:acyl carrier protein [Micromonospora zamorensis]|uniref:acyl carrier protein n=1 Tax=Micromonospora zamorensis TaxID=709883 RepID=UPI003D989E1C